MSSEILDTMMSFEINEISKVGQTGIAHQWDLYFKANGKEVKALYINNVKLDRLYLENFTDELRVSLGVTMHQWMQDIYPYRTQLEATLIKRPLGAGIEPTVDGKRNHLRATYKAQLVERTSDLISGDNPLAVNKEAGKQLAVKEFSVQLYNPVVDNIRKKTFGTNFPDTKPMDAIRYILGKIAKPESAEGGEDVIGVDVVPGYTEEVRKNIVLKHRTPVVQAPSEINNIVGGLYPTGFSYFLQNSIWYVFPPYDSKRFHSSTPTLTLLKIPQHRMPSVEKTFRVTNSQVIVLTTRETKYNDLSESAQLNSGNAASFVDANKLIDSYQKTGGNKAVVDASLNVNDTVINSRPDGDLIAQGALITTDYNLEYTKLAIKNGAFITTVWEHSNIELLIPGMPVRYIYSDGTITQELFGSLIAVETLDYKTNQNQGDPRFVTSALLTIFVSKGDPSQQPSYGAVTQSQTVKG